LIIPRKSRTFHHLGVRGPPPPPREKRCWRLPTPLRRDDIRLLRFQLGPPENVPEPGCIGGR